MHIKSITIKGFGSYGQAETIESFDVGVNSILGINGSGKSNFFKAIQFVMSPTYLNIDAEKMRSFFYKGRQDAVTSASVDIEFDNSDGRLPLDTDRVVIRRAITDKTDTFSINGKLYSKTELSSFLETAGFSRDNPYYIVEQGSVKRLCELSDADRLRLLKEIAGTRVYEERRGESLRILDDTTKKIEDINGLIEEMNQNLTKLESEKDQFVEFEKYDKERRSCMYYLATKDINDTEAKIKQYEDIRAEKRFQLNTIQNNMENVTEQIEQKEDEIELMQVDLSGYDHAIQTLDKNKQDLDNEITSLDVNMNVMRNRVNDDKETKERRSIDREKCREALERHKRELDESILLDLESNQKELELLKDSCGNERERLNRLERRKEMRGQYQNKAEWNEYLLREMTPLREEQKKCESIVSSREREKNEVSEELEKWKRVLLQRQNEISFVYGYMEYMLNPTVRVICKKELQQTLDEVNQTALAISGERKRLWTIIDEEEQELKKVQVGLEKAKEMWNTAISTDMRMGLEQLHLIPDLNASLVYGPLASLLHPVNSSYMQAIEATAGIRLFHVVVKNASVASRIIDYMRKEKKGRVTLFPLDEMGSEYDEHFVYPSDDRCYPLIRCIEYDEMFKSIMFSIFGHTVLCENLAVATEICLKYAVNCVTMTGERVNRDGVINGGYSDSKKSRYGIWSKLNEGEKDYKEKKDEMDQNKKKLDEIDQSELMNITQQTQAESAMKQLTLALSRVFSNERDVINAQDLCKQRFNTTVQAYDSAVNALNSMNKKCDELQEEMEETEEKEVEEEELSMLKNSVKEKEALISEKEEDLNMLSNRRLKVENTILELTKDILEYEENTLAASSFNTADDSSIQLQNTRILNRRNDIEVIENRLNLLQEKRNKASSELERRKAELAELQKQEESLEKEQNSAMTEIQSTIEKRQDLIGLINSKRRDFSRITSIPEGAGDYRNCSVHELKRKLKIANDRLSKFDKVNCRAMGEYVTFNEKRSQFIARNEELKSDMQSIHHLIETLDERKNQAISTTYKQVAKHFQEVFKQLVENGDARLIMQKETSESDEYSGIKIRARFTSNGEETNLAHMSGGQKAIVALALIFAIQRCDPAPFYLMDEVDAELDVNYRRNLAKLILSQSRDAEREIQVFCSTFKPEIVEIADRFYRISSRNEASRIERISKEEAIHFVNTKLCIIPDKA